MKARRLNNFGLEEFSKYIEHCRMNVSSNIPIHLLDDDRYSTPIDFDITVRNTTFSSRFDLGSYLVERFENINTQRLIGDQGFWSWLALFWFDQLCPCANGIRKASKEYNYILSKNYNHRPRHAIYMTWQLVNRYGDDARFMLSKVLSTRGEIIEQMMARQEFLSSEGVIRLASHLYSDPATGSFKKGAAARKSAGCIYRYVSWLQQLQVTYDVFSTTKEDLEELLPTEFNRFSVV